MKNSAEKKLQLTKFLREENQMNRMKMRTREQILYGKGITGYSDKNYEDKGEEEPLEQGVSGFWMRMAVALLIFGIVWYMKDSNTSFGIIDTNWIKEQVSVSGEGKLLDFLNDFSYTLHIDENQMEIDETERVELEEE